MKSLSRVLKGGRLEGEEPCEVKVVSWTEVAGSAGADSSLPGGEGASAGAARDLMARVREEAREIRKSARREGFRQGYREGLERGREQAKRLLANMEAELDGLAGELRKNYEDLVEGLAPQLVELVMAAARKIIGDRLSGDDEAVYGLVSGALRRVREDGRVVLRLSPEDAARMEGRREELERISGAGGSLVIREDPTVTGGCLVETERGTLDATLDKQLEKVEQALKEASGIGSRGR